MSPQKERNKNQAKTVAVVMVIMMLGKITGLVRDILFASNYGTSSLEAEAFAAASQIPTRFLDVFFAAAFTSSFIPVFSQYLKKKGEKEAFKLSNNFLTLVFILTAVSTLALTLCASGVISVMAPGYSSEAKSLAAQLLRVILPTIILSGAAFSITGILQGLDEFNAPAAMSLISNLLIIVYLLFFIDKFGIIGYAAVFLIGWGTQILIQIPSLIKKGFKFKPFISLKDPGIREIGRLMPPVMVSSWAIPINIMVNTSAASSVSQGVPALKNAYELFSVITGVFVYSIANVMFTKFSQQQAEGKTDELGKSLTQSARFILFFVLPMSAGIFALAPLIVRIVFERGAFDAESTLITSSALRFYALGMAGFGLQTILSRGFYAAKEGKTPLITSLIAIASNAALSFTLAGPLGVGGPAIAFAVSISITSIIMAVILFKRKMLQFNSKFILNLGKMLLSAVTMGFVVYFVNLFAGGIFGGRFLFDVLTAAISIAVGIIWYFLLALILRTSDAKECLGFIKNFIGRKKHG